MYDPARYGGEGMGEELARHYLREICRGLTLHVGVLRDLKPTICSRGGWRGEDLRRLSELFEYDEAGGDDGGIGFPWTT